MVSESDGHGVRERQIWCKRMTVMVLESYCASSQCPSVPSTSSHWCSRVTVVVSTISGYGIRD
jgi:hypothetical protein